MTFDHESWSESRYSDALTSYCFGGLAAEDREAVERHLMDCDACWQQFQQLDTAVRILRLDATLQVSPPPAQVVALLGLSSRLDRPFGGHRAYASGIAVLFGLIWTTAIWTELGDAYQRFGHLAWALSAPTGIWAAGNLVLALWLAAKSTRTGESNGLMRSTAVVLATLIALTASLMWILPAEPTIVASFQTRTASGGFLKDVLSILLPLLLFILPPFHTVLTLQRSLSVGGHRQVSTILARKTHRVLPRGMLYLSPQMLAGLLVILGLVKLVGANYMLDALTPGPYAQLFSVASYISTGLWLAIAGISVIWYASSLNELKRESQVMLALPRHEMQPREH